jgi:hypothetical protein
MQPIDNSQFTEEERAEAYRQAHMEQVIRQTKALESIRSYVGWLSAIVVIGILVSAVVALVANSSFYG